VLQKMKIQSGYSRLFLQRKNVLFAFFLVFTFLFGTVDNIHAAVCDGYNTAAGCVVGGTAKAIGSGVISAAGTVADSLFKPLAIGILSVEAALANAAAGLFVWMLDPNSFDQIMNHNPAIYEIWKITRDTMNMLFILVLLFSAFATIYQIDKYKYNKILWYVIIMALLVNFSFPISRTIIDFFNSMMYFFVDSVFHSSGTAIASSFLGGADLKNIFLPQGDGSTWSQIFLALIVMFIFMITLLVLSLMMLIRLAALPILVMFSPVGFAGMAAPFTQSYARDWWKKLLQYASYGPIVVFMVLVSVRVMQSMGGWQNGMAATMKTVSANTGAMDATVLTTLVNFAIPIILFWIAITSAEKMGNALAGTSVNFGSRIIKSAARQPWRGAKAAANWTGVPGGVKQAWKDRRVMFGSNSTRAREAREANIAGRIGAFGAAGGGMAAGAANAQYAAQEKRVAAELEALKKFGNVTQAKAMMNSASSSPDKKKAAALYLSEKEALTSANDFNAALVAVGKDLGAARGIISKAPKTVLKNATEFEKSLEILNKNGHQKLFGEVIAKAEKKALGNTGAEYDKVLAQLQIKQRDDNGVVMKDAAGNDLIDIDATADLKKTYDKRIVEQGQAHIQVDSIASAKAKASGRITPNDTDRTVAYEEIIGKMKTEDLANQDETMLKEASFTRYLSGRDNEYRKQVMASAGRRGRSAVTASWEAAGIPPVLPSNSNTTGARQSSNPNFNQGNWGNRNTPPPTP
jgi:hypothetical protein